MEQLSNILTPKTSEQRERLREIKDRLAAMTPEQRKAERYATERQQFLDSNAEECEEQMAKMGYAPKPYCSKCAGAGHFGYDVPVEDEDFGKVFMCDEPKCLKDSFEAFKRGEPQMIKRGLRVAQTFATFRPIKGTEEAYKLAMELASVEADFSWLLICGGCGNGKSHLANAVTMELEKKGIESKLWDCHELWGYLRSRIPQGDMEAELEIIQDYTFLALDDFNPRTDKEWETTIIERILIHRYRGRMQTMMTTNRDLVQDTEFGEKIPTRIASRFNDQTMSRCVVNEGKDYRMRGA